MSQTAIAVAPEYRTQKAAGLKALKDYSFNTPGFDIYGVEHFQYESPYDRDVYSREGAEMQERLTQLKSLEKTAKGDEKYYLSTAINSLEAQIRYTPPTVIGRQLGMFPSRSGLDRFIKKFVRPCPMVPRHGFVDSRPVNTFEEAEALLEETLKVEDRAEFIVMPYIKAKYSGIWTTGKLVLGTGNDGATAGHTSRLIPVLGFPSKDAYHWEQALIKGRVTETPYVELLWEQKYEYSKELINYFVQLRNGPKLPDTVDFIPEEIEVQSVVIAEGDLLEWETRAKEFPRGTVIYHPGGSLASHYAVHGVLAKLPVLISREPKIGEILQPTTENYEPKIEDIRKGFYLGATTEMSFQNAALAMLVGCHSTSVWLGRQDILLGFAMGCAYRLTVSAALGEFRHEPGRKRKPARESVYNGVWKKILNSSTRTRFMKSLDSFNNNDEWGGSFGGKKWYAFGSFAAAIFNSILDGNVSESLQNLNKCVNASHNSGWGFDKFISKQYMNMAAKNPSSIIMEVAPILYETILSGEKEMDDWFAGKHHVELEPVDEDGARRDEEREGGSPSPVKPVVKTVKKTEVLLSASVTKDSVGNAWVKYVTSNNDLTFNPYNLTEVSMTPEQKEKFALLYKKAGDKKVLGYIGLKLIGDYGYLFAGPDSPNNSWAADGYICFTYIGSAKIGVSMGHGPVFNS